MCGSRYATADFMTSADCKTNGSCMRPEPNSSPTVFMPAISGPLTMSSAGRAQAESFVQLGLEAVAGAVYHSLLEAAVHGPIAAVLFFQTLRYGPFEKAQQFARGSYPLRGVPTVVYEVEADLDRFSGQPVERHDAAGVDDGGVEAGFLAFVQEDRVEGLAGRRG